MVTFRDELDSGATLLVNGKPMLRAIYKLILTKRDMNLFCLGILPHRGWRFGDVKAYFGLRGRKESVRSQILDLCEEHLIDD